MAKKKKFYNEPFMGSDKMNDVFPSSDKKTPVSQISNGNSGSYEDNMSYIDKEIKKNSNFKNNTD